MTPEFEAAQRISQIKPNAIRSFDDDSVRQLIADMAVIGVGRTAAQHLSNLDEARSKLSDMRYWASILVAASRVMREAEQNAKPKPASRKAPATRSDRIAALASTAEVGITATEANEFLASLPPLPLYGEPGCPFNPMGMEA